ncbi:hypothetical protein ACCO45_006412 [Purpureocillium lilacinum]|uniref:Uncharacterized protein n=1 Tax=Purpureocillium lilacinum TaxID=33203 RepID=A0ACC4DSG1_PURLI
MGWGMANNLRTKIPALATLCVCEISDERLIKWLAQAPGPVSVASNPKAVVEQSDVVITMLPAGPHVMSVFTDPQTGMLSANASYLKKKLFLECSTIDIETSLRLAADVKTHQHCDFIDAPVSGGVHGADTGTLSVMVGCESSELFNRVKPILCFLGKPQKIFHCGDVSAGLATKQINNYLSCITMLGTCEAMTLGLRSGLDPTTLAEVIKQNPVRGVSSLASASRDFEGGFTTEMAKGVLDMALSHGDKVGAKLVLGSVVSEFYERAAGHPKCRGKDFRSIFKLFSENEG